MTTSPAPTERDLNGLEADPLIVELSRILDQLAAHHELERVLGHLPKDALEPTQLEVLALINDHFNGETDGQGEPEVAEQPPGGRKRGSGGGGEPRPKKQARSNETSDRRWKKIMDLEDLGDSDSCLAQWLKLYDGEQDAALLVDPGQEQGQALRESLGERKSALDYAKVAYIWAREMEFSFATAAVRFDFAMLSVYDVYRSKYPEGGDRIGRVMGVQLAEALGLPEEETIENIRRMVKIGKKLSCLADKFGEGAFFYLAHLMTPKWIESKMTLEGGPAEAAFKKLAELNLRQKADDEGATELGRRFRRLMTSGIDGIRHTDGTSTRSDGGERRGSLAASESSVSPVGSTQSVASAEDEGVGEPQGTSIAGSSGSGSRASSQGSRGWRGWFSS